MATFTAFIERVALAHYVADKGLLVVGRSLDANITLEHDTVSRRHAVIKREGPVWIVQNEGGHNGMFVNGQFKDFHVLKDGDTLEFGAAVLVFRAQSLVPKDGLPIVHADAVRDQRGGIPLKPTDRLSVEQIERLHKRMQGLMGAHLSWQGGGGEEQTALMPPDRPLVIGHGKDADVQVGWNLLEGSRPLEIQFDGSLHRLVRRNRFARAQVDGKPLEDSAPLIEGSTVEFRGRSFVFRDRVVAARPRR